MFMGVLLFPSYALGDWSQFRGPQSDGTTTVSKEALPLRWNSTENIAWRTELPGLGWSSPILVGDFIVCTAAIAVDTANENSDLELSVLMLDAQSGKLQQRIPLFTQSGSDAPSIHKKNSHASPTPVFDGERIYIHFGHQGTACVTPDGQIAWRNDQLAYRPVHGNGGSPVLYEDLLIFTRDGGDSSEVTALNKLTGDLVWQTERQVEVSNTFSFCTPLLIETPTGEVPVQLIVPGSNVVQSLEPRTGKEIWRVTYEGFSVIPQPVMNAGLVFVCTGYSKPSLLAIDPSGRGDVTQTHIKWKVDGAAIPHTPSLVALGDSVVAVSDQGISAAYTVESGRELWKERIGGNFSASPLLAGDRIYLLSEEGVCTVMEIGDSPATVARNEMGERSLASPAVVGNDLIIRTAQAMYRIHGQIK
jgi:outer membrane protein assembly factor BamB